MNELIKIDFHGSTLLAYPGDAPNNPLIAMKPVVEGMGLAWQSQLAKLKSHPILSKGVTDIVIPSSGGPQSTVAISLNKLNFWLATIQPNKVAPEIRAKVVLYQEECAEVLFAHFGGILTPQPKVPLRDVGGVVRSVTNKAMAALAVQVAATVAASEKRMADEMAASEKRIANERAAAEKRHTEERAAFQEKVESIAYGNDPSVGKRLSQMTMLQIVEANGVTMKKDRAKLTRALSSGMVPWCRANGVLTGQTAERKTILYPVECIPRWLHEIGGAKIRAHIARVTGQGVFDYDAEKKKRK